MDKTGRLEKIYRYLQNEPLQPINILAHIWLKDGHLASLHTTPFEITIEICLLIRLCNS